MSKLVVADHLMDIKNYSSQTNLKFEGFILPGMDINFNLNYFVSPVELGFNLILDLFDKFDSVEFLMDHNNDLVKIFQFELKKIYFNEIHPKVEKPLLDKTKIHFFGCSHTHGTGHSCKSTTYPSVLAALIDKEYINYGMPGKSNYDIEDLMNTFSINDATVVVQFTDMYRIRYMSDHNRVISEPIYKSSLYPKYTNTIFLSEENLFFNFKKIVERIANRLREGNNKFLFTYTYNINTEYSVNCLDFLFNFSEFESLGGSVVDRGTDNQHYGIKSHALWAEKMYNKWTKLYR